MSRFKLFTTIALSLLSGGLIVLGVIQFKTTQELKSLDELGNPKTDITGLKIDDNKAFEAVSNSKSNSVNDSSLIYETDDITTLQASISALLERIETLEQGSGKATYTQTSSTTNKFQKETLFLGSATSTNTNWTNSGLEVIIDSSDYPDTISIFFEAGLSIIGGEASARMINKTTGAIISSTEISNNSNEVVWKTSAAFKPHHGKNTYVMQIRSSSGETANVTGARLIVR